MEGSNKVNLMIVVLIILIAGLVVGYYLNNSKVKNLQADLAPYRIRDNLIKKAEEDALKSLQTEPVSQKQIRQAELDALKALRSSSAKEI